MRSYRSIGRRNENALSHGKIAKHMMHLVRLYLMCHDILASGRIVTYREKDHDLLMDIRNGAYLDDNDQPTPAFYELVDTLEADMNYWKQHTHLPDHPDMRRVNLLHREINAQIVFEDYVDKDEELTFTEWRSACSVMPA